MATVKLGLLIEYSDLFDDEPQSIDFYLRGLNQKYLEKSLLFLLGPFLDESQNDFRQFLLKFFSHQNREFAQKIYSKLKVITNDNKISSSILNKYTLLTMFEAIYKNKTDDLEFGYDAEIRIFKAILIGNQHQNLTKKRAYPLIKERKFPQSTIALAFPYTEINNNNPTKIFITQLVKMIKLMDFLSSHDMGCKLLEKYLNEFGFTNIDDYVNTLTLFISQSINTLYVSKTCEFYVGQSNEFSTICNFIDRLILDSNTTKFEEDFTTIKRNPIIKLGVGHYQIIYLPFVLEKIFRGMYFHLDRLNKNFHSEGQPYLKNFRGVYCYEFSEKTLLYSLLLDIYKKRYKCFTGEEIKNKGVNAGPDFYMRSGKHVYLFECKDVMIDKKIKVSNDYQQYEAVIREKLYNKKEGNVGIYQLINNILKIYTGGYSFDNGLFPEKVKIYPILVVHDRSFNVAGLNVLLNLWFEEEKNILKAHGYPISNVQNLVLIDIDTLIFYKQELQNPSIKLNDLLNGYLKKIRYDEEQIIKRKLNLLNNFIPFSTYADEILSVNKRNDINLIKDIQKFL